MMPAAAALLDVQWWPLRCMTEWVVIKCMNLKVIRNVSLALYTMKLGYNLDWIKFICKMMQLEVHKDWHDVQLLEDPDQ